MANIVMRIKNFSNMKKSKIESIEDLEKSGKPVPIGTTAIWGDGKQYRKVSENNWQPTEERKSHKEHASGGPTKIDESEKLTPNKLHAAFSTAMENMSKENRAIFRNGKFDFEKKRYTSSDGKHYMQYANGKITVHSNMEKADRKGPHKYIRRFPDGKGGWNYEYADNSNDAKKKHSDKVVHSKGDESDTQYHVVDEKIVNGKRIYSVVVDSQFNKYKNGDKSVVKDYPASDFENSTNSNDAELKEWLQYAEKIENKGSFVRVYTDESHGFFADIWPNGKYKLSVDGKFKQASPGILSSLKNKFTESAKESQERSKGLKNKKVVHFKGDDTDYHVVDEWKENDGTEMYRVVIDEKLNNFLDTQDVRKREAYSEVHPKSEFQDMQKADRTGPHKYFKRIPNPNPTHGRKWIYFYTHEQVKQYQKDGTLPNEKKSSIWQSIMSFFGVKDEKQANEKTKELFTENHEQLGNVTLKTFASHLSEYLSNKESWDKKLSGSKKEKSASDKKKQSASEKKPVSGEKSKSQWDITLMRKISGIVSGKKEKESKYSQGKKIIEKEREKTRKENEKRFEEMSNRHKKLNESNPIWKELSSKLSKNDLMQYRKLSNITDIADKLLSEKKVSNQEDAENLAFDIWQSKSNDIPDNYGSDKSAIMSDKKEKELPDQTDKKIKDLEEALVFRKKNNRPYAETEKELNRLKRLKEEDEQFKNKDKDKKGKEQEADEIINNWKKVFGNKFNDFELLTLDHMRIAQQEGKTQMIPAKAEKVKEKMPNLYKLLDKNHLKYAGALPVTKEIQKLIDQYNKSKDNFETMPEKDKSPLADAAEKLDEAVKEKSFLDKSFEDQVKHLENDYRKNSLSELKDMLQNDKRKNHNTAIKNVIKEKEQSQKNQDEKSQEAIKSQEWTPTKINTEGFKIFNGSITKDVPANEIKDTFKVWGEDLIVIKSGKYVPWQVYERKTGLRIAHPAKTKNEAIEETKKMLGISGKEKFHTAIKNAKQVNVENNGQSESSKKVSKKDAKTTMPDGDDTYIIKNSQDEEFKIEKIYPQGAEKYSPGGFNKNLWQSFIKLKGKRTWIKGASGSKEAMFNFIHDQARAHNAQITDAGIEKQDNKQKEKKPTSYQEKFKLETDIINGEKIDKETYLKYPELVKKWGDKPKFKTNEKLLHEDGKHKIYESDEEGFFEYNGKKYWGGKTAEDVMRTAKKVIQNHKDMESEGFSDMSQYVKYKNDQLHKEEQKKFDEEKKQKDEKEKRKMTTNKDKAIYVDMENIQSKDHKLKGRILSILDKQYNSNGKILSLKDLIESGKYINKETIEVPKVQFNRTKFNRMDNEDQKEYEKKLNEKKTLYTIKTKDETFIEVPKIVYDAIVVNKTNEKLEKAFSLMMQELQKAKKAEIGETRTYKDGSKWRKVGPNKWEPVKEGKNENGKKPDEKKPDEKKPDGKKPEKKPDEKQDSAKRTVMKDALKKVADILANALSSKETVEPTSQAIEKTGDNLKDKSQDMKKQQIENEKKKREIEKKKKQQAQQKKDEKAKG